MIQEYHCGSKAMKKFTEIQLMAFRLGYIWIASGDILLDYEYY